MFSGVSRFLFSILQQRDRLKHPAVAKILSKDINPANAAILAVSRYWPAVYLGELTMHTAELPERRFKMMSHESALMEKSVQPQGNVMVLRRAAASTRTSMACPAPPQQLKLERLRFGLPSDGVRTARPGYVCPLDVFRTSQPPCPASRAC